MLPTNIISQKIGQTIILIIISMQFPTRGLHSSFSKIGDLDKVLIDGDYKSYLATSEKSKTSISSKEKLL